MSRPQKDLSLEHDRDRTLRFIAWSLGTLALIAIVTAARIAGEIVAPTVLAGLFALTLAPLVAAFEKVGVPPSLGAGVLVGSSLAGVIGGIYLLAPSAEEWRLRAPSIMRSLEWKLRDIEREIEEGVDKATGGRAAELGDQESATDAVIESGQRLVTDAFLAAPEVLATFLYIAFLCFFLLAERAALRRFTLSLWRGLKTRVRLSRGMRNMRRNVGRYLLMITSINIGLGLAAGVAFSLLGLPNAPLWGAMIALLNYMPYLGPLIANIVVFAVGFTTFNGVAEAIYPVLALATLNVAEGQAVTPMVIGRRARVGALSVFLALAFGAWLWGALGAFVATPLLIVARSLWQQMAPVAPAPDRRAVDGERATLSQAPAS